MKVIRIIPIFLVLTMMLAGRGYADPLQITVSIVPEKYFVEKIGADLVQVNVMVRPGSSPATYEPQPRQMAQLSRAEIYYAIGVPFERAWLPRFKGANADLNIVDLSKEVVRMPMQDHVHHSDEPKHGHMDKEEHHDNFIADPHIWLSPPLVRVMAMKIRDTLIEKDPVHESVYRNNYIKFAAEIDSLDTELLKLFSDAPRGAGFMVYHPSWGYFARSYGLRQIPIEIEGKEPSPKEMGELIEIARKNSVSAIFIQPQFSRKSAEAIASSIGAVVLVADPLAEDWAENLRNAAAAFHKNAG